MFWEDYPAGFYENLSGKDKDVKIARVLEMFNSESKTREYMLRVISEWKYSCEQNLTNEAINQVAYLGQAACCIFARVPSTITMEAWSLLKPKVQDRANKIAAEVLMQWDNNNKIIQLCLNIV